MFALLKDDFLICSIESQYTFYIRLGDAVFMTLLAGLL